MHLPPFAIVDPVTIEFVFDGVVIIYNKSDHTFTVHRIGPFDEPKPGPKWQAIADIGAAITTLTAIEKLDVASVLRDQTIQKIMSAIDVVAKEIKKENISSTLG